MSKFSIFGCIICLVFFQNTFSKCTNEKNKYVEYYQKNTTVKEDTTEQNNPILFSLLFREGVVLGKVYTCPGGYKTSGAGNTQNPKIVKTLDEAIQKLYQQIFYYKDVVHRKWPYLNDNQQYAVVSLAMNCKWDSVFNSSFSRSLDKKEIPDFTKYCYARGKFYYNLYQSRLYEQALFENKETFKWVNPFNGYKTEETTLTDIQNFYANFWHERVIVY